MYQRVDLVRVFIYGDVELLNAIIDVVYASHGHLDVVQRVLRAYFVQLRVLLNAKHAIKHLESVVLGFGLFQPGVAELLLFLFRSLFALRRDESLLLDYFVDLLLSHQLL